MIYQINQKYQLKLILTEWNGLVKNKNGVFKNLPRDWYHNIGIIIKEEEAFQ